MREVTTNIELEQEVTIDIDVLRNNAYIAITNKGSIALPFDRIKIFQSFKFPIIRHLTNNSFLIAEARTSTKLDNCFIYDLTGNVRGQFYAGDGIQDIEVLRDKIIITYFDEGVYGTDGPNNEGLVVFDFDGKILYKYNRET
jgi:hypothetical protein